MKFLAIMALGISTNVDEGGDSSTDEGDDADEPSSSKDKADKSSKDEEPKETIVKVKLKEKGAVAWIEVKLDGKIVLGKQVVGPFEEEFKVETQIDITTNTPSAVAIYKNGDKVRYDTKVSVIDRSAWTELKGAYYGKRLELRRCVRSQHAGGRQRLSADVP